MGNNKKSRPPSKLGTVRKITDLSPACYRLSSDGRKWKALCEARQKLANWLALKGNPDGTSIHPGIKKMAKVALWSRSKVFYVLEDLRLIGCIVNEEKLFSERGTALRRFDVGPLLHAHKILEQGQSFTHPDTRVKKSRAKGRPRKQDSPKAEIQHSEVGSSRVDLQACKLEYSIVSPK